MSRLEDLSDCGHYLPEAHALTSIAVSLKRIADAIEGKPGTTGIHELLNGIEAKVSA